MSAQMSPDERQVAEYVAVLEAAITDAIETVETCCLYEGELSEQERLLAVLRGALRLKDGQDV